MEKFSPQSEIPPQNEIDTSLEVFFSDYIDIESVQSLINNFGSYAPLPTEIIIRLNSEGGNKDAFISYLRWREENKDLKVTTIAEDIAFSCAAAILATGTKGRRFAKRNSIIMLHQIQYGALIINGNSQELAKQAVGNLVYDHAYLTRLASDTGHSYEQILKDTGQNLFMNAEDALAYGVIDGIINPNDPCPKKPPRYGTPVQQISEDMMLIG